MVFGLGGEVAVVADEWVTLMSCSTAIVKSRPEARVTLVYIYRVGQKSVPIRWPL